jgi:hypothetical protein
MPTEEVRVTNLYEPRGLGGWLVLPVIGLIFTVARTTVLLVIQLVPIFSQGYWGILTSPGSEAYHVLWGPILIGELVGNFLSVLFGLVLLYLYFTKSYRFPMLYIVFMIYSLLFVVTDLFASNLIPAVAAESNIEAYKEIVRTAIAAAIWIPYMLVSKRVKNTFVKTELSSDRSDTEPSDSDGSQYLF